MRFYQSIVQGYSFFQTDSRALPTPISAYGQTRCSREARRRTEFQRTVIPGQGFGRLILDEAGFAPSFRRLRADAAPLRDAAFAVLQCEVVLSPGSQITARFILTSGSSDCRATLWSANRRRPNTAPATCTRTTMRARASLFSGLFSADPAEGPNRDAGRAELRAAPPACSLPKTLYKLREWSPREKRGLRIDM